LDSDSDSEQVKYLLEWLFFNNKKSVCRFWLENGFLRFFTVYR
jgi:hypothetical protein